MTAHFLGSSRAARNVLLVAILVAARRASAQQAAPIRLTLADAIAIAQKQGLAAKMATEAANAATWNARSFSAGLRPQLFLTGAVVNLNHSIVAVTQPDGTQNYVSQRNNVPSLSLGVQQQISQTGSTVTLSSGLTKTDQGLGALNTHSWTSAPLTVRLDQPLFKPRTLEWQKRDQEITTSLSQRQYLEAKESAGIDAASAFLALYAAEVAARNATTSAAISDTIYRVNQQRYAAAQVNQVDLNQSQLYALQSRITRDNADIARQQAEATLRRLLNLTGSAPLQIVPPEQIPRLEIDPEMAVQKALANSSLRDQLELAASDRDHDVDVARLNNGPNVTIGASAGVNQTAPTFGDVYSSPLGRQTVFMGVNLPILQWGLRSAAVQGAKAAQTQAAISARIEREQTSENVRALAQNVIQASQSVGLNAQSDTVAGVAFAIARSQYAAGNIQIDRLLQVQQSKDASTAGYVQAIRAFWQQYYSLQRLCLYDFINKADIKAP